MTGDHEAATGVSGRPGAVPLLLIGLAAGVLSGLFGVGGGTVLVPLLVLALGFAQKRAQATSLFAIAITAVAGAASYLVAGEVIVVPALAIAAGGIVGTFIGSELLHRLSEAQVRIIFVIIMFGAAARMLWGRGDSVDGSQLIVDGALLLGFAAAGLAMGTLSSLIGVGGGIVLVPILIFAFGLGSHIAQGTSLLVMIPIALMGSWRNSRRGRYVDWRAGALAGCGGVVGAVIGAAAALELSDVWLQRGFAVLLVITAVQLLRRARR